MTIDSQPLWLREWVYADAEPLAWLLDHVDLTYDHEAMPIPCPPLIASVLIEEWRTDELRHRGSARAVMLGQRVVGLASVFPAEDVPERRHDGLVGLILLPEVCHKGIGTWVMQRLVEGAAGQGFLRLTAHVYAPHEASRRLLAKCGFELEGCMHGAVRKGDTLMDYLVYGLQLAR